jgi:hypothetical protein
MFTIDVGKIVVHRDGSRHPASDEINRVTKIEELRECLFEVICVVFI